MGIQAKIGGFVRRALTWPILVVVALNIENATSNAGYDTFIDQHWKDADPVLSGFYSWAISPLIWYPALMILGIIIYEWILRFSGRMEAKDSWYRMWLLASTAEASAPAFLRKGLARKLLHANPDLNNLNRRLASMDMPKVPEEIGDNEVINAIFGSYLTLVANHQFAHAKSFLAQANLNEASEPQSPEGTGQETPL